MKELSRKYAEISPSLTLAIAAKANELRAKGEDIVSFSAGEPDFNTPENIRNVAIERINRGGNGYTSASGLTPLKEAVAAKLKKDNGLEYSSSQIVVSNGAKHAISNTLLSVLNPGDEVIMINPYWVSYKELVKMAEGVPVFVDADPNNHFKATAEQIAEKVTPKTKLLIINSPNNPTGAVYTKEELQAIGNLAIEHDFYILSDEIYEKLVYGVQHTSIASLSEELYKRTIVINGLSKAYAMTGWRIGYSASSIEIAKMIANIQSHETSNPNTIAQYSAIEALESDKSTVAIEEMRVEFMRRRDIAEDLLSKMPNISHVSPEGAFYIMVDVSAFYNSENGIANSTEFASKLLDEQKVAVIPGVAFGVDNYIRLSYATSEENIRKGLGRIAEFVKGLKA